MSPVAVTVDLDWACEAAIEETLDFLRERRIPITVFVTHRSARVERSLGELEVGLHPYFGPDSSHGSSVADVVRHVLALPHNIPAFRCHRFASCNVSREALADAGLSISSNVCTDLEIVAPFRDRYGTTEVPIFMEDGGYLLRRHPLDGSGPLARALAGAGAPAHVLVVHPMHFAVNTPTFDYMREIKSSVSRAEWNQMSASTLAGVRWHRRGIRDVVVELLGAATRFTTVGAIAQSWA